jgi:hypothetical protein
MAFIKKSHRVQASGAAVAWIVAKMRRGTKVVRVACGALRSQRMNAKRMLVESRLLKKNRYKLYTLFNSRKAHHDLNNPDRACDCGHNSPDGSAKRHQHSASAFSTCAVGTRTTPTRSQSSSEKSG